MVIILTILSYELALLLLQRRSNPDAGKADSLSERRYFLDNVAGWIYELDRGKGHSFEGNYNEWLAAKNARLQVCF